MTKIALQLAIFVVAAVPGYALAIARMDRIGRRRRAPLRGAPPEVAATGRSPMPFLHILAVSDREDVRGEYRPLT